jgi:hypothetical protein
MRVQQEVTGRGWPYTVIRRAKSDLCIRVGSERFFIYNLYICYQ